MIAFAIVGWVVAGVLAVLLWRASTEPLSEQDRPVKVFNELHDQLDASKLMVKQLEDQVRLLEQNAAEIAEQRQEAQDALESAQSKADEISKLVLKRPYTPLLTGKEVSAVDAILRRAEENLRVGSF